MTPSYRFSLLPVLFGFVLLAGCATTQGTGPESTPVPADPLVGRTYRAGEDAPTTFDHLLEHMREADVVYLGETHDNPAHHHIQQQVVATLTQQGAKPAIGFEFFSREQTSHLLRYRASGKKRPDAKSHGHAAHADPSASEKLLRVQLGWNNSARDMDWNRFLPILRKARELQLPLFGADLPAGLIRNMTRGGYEGLNPVEQLTATLTDFEDLDYREWMHERLKAVHCGWGSPEYLQRLYETWLARNQAMAEAIVAMRKGNPGQPVVVILGGGHTEYNMAVYERVAALMPGAVQMNIRLLEVAAEQQPVASYFTRLQRNGRDYGPVHEYIWFTSRMSGHVDHCEKFRAAKASR